MEGYITLLLLLLSVASCHGWSEATDIRLARQLAQQQFYIEDKTRSEGHSGIKMMRHRGEGTQPYYGTSHADALTMAAMHDHSDFIDTFGMGEVTAVLNGVDFKTRHCDYRLLRRADLGGGFDATEPLLYPDVPPSVLALSTPEEQRQELYKYFEAFANQNTSIRDYRPYFRAHLSYMEGAWTKSEPDEIQEAFASDRHSYAANSWEDLLQKTQYESSSGTKENLEDFAYMPSKIWSVDESGPVFAQWNYKILCHQIPEDVPLSRLRGVDDLRTRMAVGASYEEYLELRNARFQVNPFDTDVWEDKPSGWGYLDKLMERIPGPDGEGAVLHDDAFDNTIKRFDAADNDSTQLNVAYYHRWFQNTAIGAMGGKVRHRGLSDENLWVAKTTQENVHASTLDMGKCKSWKQKWVYAIPMEIIYTTPLMNWNPHDIEYKGSDGSPEGQTIYEGPGGTKRDGSNHLDKAYNGTSSANFYHTPMNFFDEGEYGKDPADTPKDFVYVLNKDGEIVQVRSSGIRTFMPNIPGIGRIRQRYPIHPIHGEGSSVWKEVAAIREILMNPTKYNFMIRNP